MKKPPTPPVVDGARSKIAWVAEQVEGEYGE